MTSLDSFNCCSTLKVGTKTYAYYSLPAAEKNGLKGISRLPFSMKVLLENLLRNEDGRTVTKEDILAVAHWLKTKTSDREIAFRPARVLMQDFTGVAGGGRSRGDARRDEDARRRPEEDQPAGAGRPRHRPFGDRRISSAATRRVQEERRRGIPAEPGALHVPEMGAAARSTISAWCRPAPASATRSTSNTCRRRSGPPRTRSRSTAREPNPSRLSRHAGRHRLAHHDGQRPGRARLGRRRHRGGSRDARPAATRCCCRR